MKEQKIAVIGAGIAGLAAASFLKSEGHIVSLFEKFPAPKPIGAGMLLQPTGLRVLAQLGLERDIISKGSVIHRLFGKEVGSRFSILNVKYADFSRDLFGVGIQRNVLFDALYTKALSLNIPITTNCEVAHFTNSTLYSNENEPLGTFDMVIDASGQKSRLATNYAPYSRNKAYDYGAVWAIVELDEAEFAPDCLDQRYQQAKRMIGVLPVGRLLNGKLGAAFFWSMKKDDYADWLKSDFKEWQSLVSTLWPACKNIVTQFNHPQDLTFASYSDIVLKNYAHENLIFIGDSAHCTSPQLGQGANLALQDALAFTQALASADSVQEAIDVYTRKRKAQLTFYQSYSRILTPFFQSDSRITPLIRLICCLFANQFKFTRKLAAQVLAGTKDGTFTVMK